MPGAWPWPRPTPPAQPLRCPPLGHCGPQCTPGEGGPSAEAPPVWRARGEAGLQPHPQASQSARLGRGSERSTLDDTTWFEALWAERCDVEDKIGRVTALLQPECQKGPAGGGDPSRDGWWAVPCGGLGRGLLGRGDSKYKGPGLERLGPRVLLEGREEVTVRSEGCGTLDGIGALLLGAVESCWHVAREPHGGGGHGLGPPSTRTVHLLLLLLWLCVGEPECGAFPGAWPRTGTPWDPEFGDSVVVLHLAPSWKSPMSRGSCQGAPLF